MIMLHIVNEGASGAAPILDFKMLTQIFKNLEQSEQQTSLYSKLRDALIMPLCQSKAHFWKAESPLGWNPLYHKKTLCYRPTFAGIGGEAALADFSSALGNKKGNTAKDARKKNLQNFIKSP